MLTLKKWENYVYGRRNFTTKVKRHVYAREDLYQVTKFPLCLSFTAHYFCIQTSSFTQFLSIRIALSCFLMLIFYFEKFSTLIYSLLYMYVLKTF